MSATEIYTWILGSGRVTLPRLSPFRFPGRVRLAPPRPALRAASPGDPLVVIALARYHHAAMQLGPNPGPDELKQQRELDRRRDAASQSRLTGPFFVSTRPVGLGEGRVVAARPPAPPRDPELGAAAAAENDDDDGDRRRGPPGARPRAAQIPPYEAPAVDAFAAVILGLLAVGIVAVACVLPYQGLRDADGDGHRWQVTLARWSIARDYPVVSSLAGYAERAERGGGIEAYLPEADTTNEVFFSGLGPASAPDDIDDSDAPDLEDIDEGEVNVGIVAMGPSSWVVSAGPP